MDACYATGEDKLLLVVSPPNYICLSEYLKSFTFQVYIQVIPKQLKMKHA